MEGEVLNGVFHQYLTNSTGDSGEDVKLYLRDIGAVQTLELFQRLRIIFPGGKVPRDQDERCDIVEKWEDLETGEDLFSELSLSFYRQSESLAALMLAYVREHRADFLEPSDKVVMRLKRQDRIKAHYCGTADPEWMAKAEGALAKLTQLVEAKQGKRDVAKRNEIKSLVKSGKRSEAIQEYKKCFSCSLAEAKAAVDRLAKS
jgi:ribosomal protein L7/L12